VLGAVHNVSFLHTDELSLGCYSAPWPGVCVPAGVCACVFSYGVFSFRPMNVWFVCVSLNDWAGVRAHVTFRKFTLMNPSPPVSDLAFLYTSHNVT
jgi:hypothetical protein